MPFATLVQRKYFFQEAGEGVPFLLLHGFPFSSECFWPQLASPPAGARLIVPDHRGFGQSEMGPGPSTMEALADDALALLDHLRIEQAIVGGLSMGGYVAMALTRRDPGRVKALVLIDTQSFADDEAGRARREAAALDVERHGMGPLTKTMLPKLFSPTAAPEVVSRLEGLMLAQAPQATAAASRGMATRSDAKDILSRFAGPCLIVVGELDVLTPPDKAKVMAELMPGARLVVIPNAGHLPHLEQPEAIRASLEALVQRLKQS